MNIPAYACACNKASDVPPAVGPVVAPPFSGYIRNVIVADSFSGTSPLDISTTVL
jgi:hypothetical protein